ncbi:MAG: hypothetical protein F6K22_32095 [Okeania sp. SIO2F4]|uniref:hypothetical protein n=1 Tax=Okeania sp. SIO2F4 TaxID=2607790 RepID=UPI00142B8CCB|nr:hypothetical protein [Okeania sp. SIO2F4]NES07036.1 hypothetical protein [Okeania sp. SIO2F4]
MEKLPEMSRQELEAMFGIDDLKNTRFAQELMAESKAEGIVLGEIKGKLKVIPSLLRKGFSVEEIAEILELEIEQVRQAIANLN